MCCIAGWGNASHAAATVEGQRICTRVAVSGTLPWFHSSRCHLHVLPVQVSSYLDQTIPKCACQRVPTLFMPACGPACVLCTHV